jgi:hypothetical protein
MSQNPPQERRYILRQAEAFEQRCRRRLREDLGVNPAGVDVILQMRSQMLELQARVRQLEAELSMRKAGRSGRLARFRETFFEETWYEIEDLTEE